MLRADQSCAWIGWPVYRLRQPWRSCTWSICHKLWPPNHEIIPTEAGCSGRNNQSWRRPHAGTEDPNGNRKGLRKGAGQMSPRSWFARNVLFCVRTRWGAFAHCYIVPSCVLEIRLAGRWHGLPKLQIVLRRRWCWEPDLCMTDNVGQTLAPPLIASGQCTHNSAAKAGYRRVVRLAPAARPPKVEPIPNTPAWP